MSKSNKRTLADLDIDPSPSSKRPRNTQQIAPLHPAPETASRPSQTPSSLTLIGSIPTSAPSLSSQSDTSATDSAPSSSTSGSPSISSSPSSSEPSSSDPSSSESNSESDTRSVPSYVLPSLLPPQRTYTFGIDTDSDSPTATSTSTSASTSASIPDSSRRSSTDEDQSDSSSTDSNGSSSSEESESPSSSEDSRSPSSSEDSRSPSPVTRATAGTLTAKNLSTLQKRLDSLLPSLQSANQQLEVERREGKLSERDIQNVTDGKAEGGGKGYIEMELGLGVLEERREGRVVEWGEARSDSGSGSGKGDKWPLGEESSIPVAEDDVVAKLMGASVPKDKRKVKIEEVGGA